MHCVDLGESFPTHIHLQNLASIQPRTSHVKFAASRARLAGGVLGNAELSPPTPRTATWTQYRSRTVERGKKNILKVGCRAGCRVTSESCTPGYENGCVVRTKGVKRKNYIYDCPRQPPYKIRNKYRKGQLEQNS